MYLFRAAPAGFLLHRNTVEDIGRLHVRNAAGDMIPLRDRNPHVPISGAGVAPGAPSASAASRPP